MSQGRPFAQPWLEEVLEDLSTDVVAGQGAPIKSELALLHDVLSSVRGNREEAAKRLHISTTTLWRRMKRYLDEDPGCFDSARY